MRAILVLVLTVLLASCGTCRARVPLEGRSNSSQSWPAGYTRVAQLPRNSSSTLKPLYQPYVPAAPVFQEASVIRKLSAARLSNASSSLDRGAADDLPEGTCAPGKPCSNGSCCSKKGVCSYAPSSCAPDNCISNCDAKAPCGKYAAEGNAKCPLNVCCSEHGFCGTGGEFCGKGCQEGFGGCGPPPTPSCPGGTSAGARRIGYYESWAADPGTRPCDMVEPEDLDLTGLTHINFAFSFFHPSSFQIMPMDANAASLYSRFTALKDKRPGLQTWLSVGGWSFNDPTNTPNTRKAFSDMVSSRANRRAFITSLRNFMQTYGFDGLDIDWEYPVADDRGGRKADFENFPIFLRELRASFGNGLGITVTLPSSYWYLRHFDLPAMAPYLDWFNIMSYDIHGVWDSSNRFTGPFIRPHTNLTEIEDGLSLLWRVGVEPSMVVLGLGWYGRSFTLADPDCNVPNGKCKFTAGGAPGKCTKSSGTLSNAEIKRVLDSGGGKESYNKEAAVRWLTWDKDQWISYDDGVTMQQKIAKANRLCLGGIMIWALDLDDKAGSSMNDLMGIGTANGISDEAAKSYREQLSNATLQQSIASSCYWSLCGGSCTTGYFDVTGARGQVAGLQRNSVCAPGQFQTLCCAPGTSMGTCKWEGFRGVGFPCSPACKNPNATIVARNSNSYEITEAGQTSDLTCTGGFQAYCCVGFVPSSITNSGNLPLYRDQNGDTMASTREGIHERGLVEKRDGSLLVGTLGAICLEAAVPLLALAPFSFGLSAAIEGAICVAAAGAALAIGFAILKSIVGWFFGGEPDHPNTGAPTTSGTRSAYGQWSLLNFDGGPTAPNCDCAVTYTCRYGMGWDEVCDNQRWAIDKMLNGQTVFHPYMSGGGVNRRYSSWGQQDTQRHEAYRTLVQGKRQPRDAQCQLDEFPMANLRESGNNNPQVCRLVNRVANGAQGRDFRQWKLAQWWPCARYRTSVCNINDDGPPATWKFGPLNGNRGTGNGKHFIDAYGFDSQTPNSLCFASFTYTEGQPATTTDTMIVDHGFRVLDDDPMFGNAYGWDRQSYRTKPEDLQNPPYNYQPREFQKRDDTLAANDTTTDNATDSSGESNDRPPLVCHADPNNSHKPADANLDYENLLFLDLDGNRIDGRACDVIYDENNPQNDPTDRSNVRIVMDEDGNMVDMYIGDGAGGGGGGLWRGGEEEAAAMTTATEGEAVTITATTMEGARARPGGSGESAGGGGVPVRTVGVEGRRRSVVTMPPF